MKGIEKRGGLELPHQFLTKRIVRQMPGFGAPCSTLELANRARGVEKCGGLGLHANPRLANRPRGVEK